ncbi:hypothetical protein CK485_14685 [Streptomyces sp. ICBB 8177]|nr:hypothetical protein CK485_14685 [Streptomyces sp. ICBB 8177]
MVEEFGRPVADIATSDPAWTRTVERSESNGVPWSVKVSYSGSRQLYVTVETIRRPEPGTPSVSEVSLEGAVAVFVATAMSGRRSGRENAPALMERVQQDITGKASASSELIVAGRELPAEELSCDSCTSRLCAVGDRVVICSWTRNVPQAPVLTWLTN